MLYLLKASRITEYHQQNVAIVGAEEGAEFTISYSHRWVQPSLRPARGDGAVIVFADSPYRQFVPVRFAKVTAFTELPGSVQVTVALGPHVRVENPLVLDERWVDRDDDGRPGRRFLFEDENPGLLTPRSPDELVVAWRGVCRRLTDNAFFSRSVFGRVLGVRDGSGTPHDLDRPLPAGRDVTIELEVVGPELLATEAKVFVKSTPTGAIRDMEPVAVPVQGAAEITVYPLVAGPCRLDLKFLPEPLRSSRPTLELLVEPETVVSDVGPTPHAGDAADSLLRMVSRLERDVDIPEPTWVAILEDVVLPMAGSNPDLLETYARHAYAAGDPTKAARALQRAGRRTPEGEALMVRACIRAGITFDAGAVLPRVDLGADREFGALLEVLEDAPEVVWLELLELLPHNLLGDDKSHTFLLAARGHVSDGASRLKIAESLAFVDAEAAASFLLTSWPDPESAPAEAIDLLLELGSHRAHLLPYFTARLDGLASSGRWEEVQALLERAERALPEESRYLARWWTSRRLLSAGIGPASDAAFYLGYEAARDASLLGDLDTAVRIATVLEAYANGHAEDGFRAVARELRARQ